MTTLHGSFKAASYFLLFTIDNHSVRQARVLQFSYRTQSMNLIGEDYAETKGEPKMNTPIYLYH